MKKYQLKIMTALVVGSAATWLAAPANAQDGFVTTVKPYTLPVGPDYDVVPILSVGDQVPETNPPSSAPSRQYQMIGIPDGLGAQNNGDGTIDLYMNHELGNTIQSEPFVGGSRQRGAFVSKYVLSDDGSVLSGDRAYDGVFDTEKGAMLPPPEVGNATSGFSRFCSGALAGQAEGFDRPIYFAGEESSGAATFDGKGGLQVAVIDNVLYTLPKLGRFAWENALPRPFNGNEVVIMSMEDGPVDGSQLYMYVGKKDRRAGADVLNRNGLNNGTLYVFRSKDPSRNSENTFHNGSIMGEWVAIPDVEMLTDAQLEAASDARNAFVFVRTEDGAWSKSSRKEYYFVTTGDASQAGNKLGRIYHLELNPGNVLKDAKLTVLVNADQVVAAGGDTAVSPDNIDVSTDYLMVQEDGTGASRPVMGSKGRDGSIWRFPLSNISAATGVRVAQLNPPGRDNVPVGPGIWETSGIIDGTTLFGDGSWIFDVQAHPPTNPPNPASHVEDGQLLIMTPAN